LYGPPHEALLLGYYTPEHFQAGFAFDERQTRQIFAVLEQKIEQEEDQSPHLPMNKIVKRDNARRSKPFYAPLWKYMLTDDQAPRVSRTGLLISVSAHLLYRLALAGNACGLAISDAAQILAVNAKAILAFRGCKPVEGWRQFVNSD